ncbi:MAG: hypothetical protein H7101_01965 [Deinococcales bacterium]|nr:hypothetical protein [Chitinophagaceae bacterium]
MKSLFIIIAILLYVNTFSQTIPKNSASVPIDTLWTTNLVTLDSIAKRRNQLNKTNMTILAGWAGVNIIQSSISAANATGADKAFFNMNTYWNTVNLAIAGFGLYSVKKAMTKKLSLAQNIQAQHQPEKILLFNAGLDVGYVFSGLYLNERGQRLTNQQTEGFGKSLVLQGSFLLIFDIVQYYLHHANGKHLDKWLDKVSMDATQNGIGLSYKL